MVCTWHLPVRGKVEKRKHIDRASSRSLKASINVGYLQGGKGSAPESILLGSKALALTPKLGTAWLLPDMVLATTFPQMAVHLQTILKPLIS